MVRLDGGLTLEVAAGAGRGPAVLCVIRPESVRPAAGAGGPNRIGAAVASAVFLGGRYDCELRLDGGVRLRAEIPAGGGAPAPAPGVTFVVTIAPDDIIVIDA